MFGEGGQELLEVSFRPLNLDLYPRVAQVAHAPRQAEAHGGAIDEGAETDALDDATDMHPDSTDFGHCRACQD